MDGLLNCRIEKRPNCCCRSRGNPHVRRGSGAWDTGTCLFFYGGVDLGDRGFVVVDRLGVFSLGEFAEEGFAHGFGVVLFFGLHEIGEQGDVLDGAKAEADSEQVSASGDAIDESEGETLEDFIDGDHG